MKTKLALLFICGYILFTFFVSGQASRKALYDSGEAENAEIARHYVQFSNWFIPAYNGKDSFDNPPLQTWIIAGSYKLLGINELAVRLPSLLFAIGAIAVAYLLLRQMGIGSTTALLALGAVIFSSDFSFLSSQGVAEMQLLFFNLLCLYLVERGIKDRNVVFFTLAGVALGLGIMTKFVAVFWVGLLILSYVLTKGITVKSLLVLAVSALTVALPWHLYMLSRFGNIFVNRYILMNTFGRGAGETANIAPVYWYGIYMIDSWRPLVFLLPFAVTLSFRDKTNRLLAVWALSVLLPFSLIQSKVWWYIFPAMIPLAVLAVRSFRNRPTLSAFAMAIGSLPVWQLQYGLLKEQVVMFGFIFLGLAFIAFRKRVRHGFIRAPLTLVMVLFLLFTLGAQEKKTLEYTDQNRDLKTLVLRHRGKLPGLAVYRIPYEAALFYSDMGKISNQTDKAQFVLTNPDTEAELKGFRQVDRSGQIILLKRE